MGFLNEELFLKEQKELEKIFLADTLGRTDDAQITQMQKSVQSFIEKDNDSMLHEGTARRIVGSMIDDSTRPLIVDETEEQKAERKERYDRYIAENYPDKMVEMDPSDSLMLNQRYRERSRDTAAGYLAKLQSGDYAIGRQVERWENRNSTILTPEQANEYSKEQGMDIKWDKPVSMFSVQQSIDTLRKRQLMEQALEKALAYDNGDWVDTVKMFGASIVGGTGPIELTASVLLGWAVPELTIAMVSKGATTLKAAAVTKNMLKAKKVMDAKKGVNAAKIANKIDDATGAATKTAEQSDVATVLLRGKDAAKKAAEAERRTAEHIKKLDDLSKLTYDKLTWSEKTLADAAGYLTVDQQFINNTYRNSQEMNIDLYTEQDKAVDTLLASALGVGAGVLRKVGSSLGIMPKALILRRLDEADSEVDMKLALGDITPEQAAAQKEASKVIREHYDNKGAHYKQVHPTLQTAAENLEKTNVSDETITKQIQYVMQQIINGNVPKISDIPQYESIMSHIHSDIIRSLKQRSIVDAFGSAIISEKLKNGLTKIKINGETGLLGWRQIAMFTEQDALDIQELAYKAHVLRDEKALKELKEKSARYTAFTQEARNIFNMWKEAFEHNKAAKKEDKIPGHQLPRVGLLLQKEYLKYRFGEEFVNEYFSEVKYRKDASIMLSESVTDQLHSDGRIDDSLREILSRSTSSPEDQAFAQKAKQVTEALKEWEEIFEHQWITPAVEKGEGKKYLKLFDFTDGTSGKKDPTGKAFSDFLGELDTAANDVDFLANADNVINEMNINDVQDWVKRSMEFDVSPDTDMDKLFNVPRVSSAEVETQLLDAEYMEGKVREENLKLEAKRQDTSFTEAEKALARFSNVDAQNKSAYTKSIEALSAIKELKQVNTLEQIKANIFKALRENNSLQDKLARFFGEEGEELDRGVVHIIRGVVNKTLKEAGLSEYNVRANAITKLIVQELKQTIKDNPDKLEIFQEASEIISNKELPGYVPEFFDIKENNVIDIRTKEPVEQIKDMEEGLAERRTEAASKHRAAIRTFFEPIEYAIRAEFATYELELINNINVSVRMQQLMRANPQIAAEIPTGMASQTYYTFLGSQQSVEHKKRNAGLYLNDIQNQLAKEKSSVEGKTLLDLYRDDKVYKEQIVKELVAIKHGLETKENTDAHRIAKIIANNRATLVSGFRKQGSRFSGQGSLINKSKLRYADTAISQFEINAIFSGIQKSISDLTGPNIKLALGKMQERSRAFVGETPVVKRGDRYVEVNEDLINKITDDMLSSNKKRTLDTIVRDFNNIEDPAQRNIAIWALSDFDLDEMLDPDLTSAISLNEVRDALLQGRLLDFIAEKNDVQAYFDTMIALRRIHTFILGKNLKVHRGKVVLSQSGWVNRFQRGFHDITAAMSGRRAAVMDDLDNPIKFKDADAEIRAVEKFGYDSYLEFIQNDFELLNQGLATLENFGSRPAAIVTDAINTYNKSLHNDSALQEKLAAEMESRDMDPKKLLERYAIKEAEKESIMENVALACGLQNKAPSTATRIVKVLRTFLSVDLLAKAGWKSLSDYSTIWGGLTMNSLVDGGVSSGFKALGLTGKATKVILSNKSLLNLFLGTSIIQNDELARIMLNDSGTEALRLISKASSPAEKSLEKLEHASRMWANFFMNTCGRMGSITNHNKMVAGLSIQMAIGENAHKAYSQLAENLQYFLEREGISEQDWDFIRTKLVWDINTYLNKVEQVPGGIKGDSFNLCIPTFIMRMSDDVLIEEMKRRGIKRITQDAVNDFRQEMASKVWNMTEIGSDEMVSIPSGRVQNFLRGGKTRNSTIGTLAETITQFQAFGAALVYNTYGRFFANFAKQETGISIVDLFNGSVRLNKVNRVSVGMQGAALMSSIALTMIIVDTLVAASTGKVQKLYTEKNGEIELHGDTYRSAAIGALGMYGTFLNAILDGVDSGQRGGGFAMQVAPSASNVLRRVVQLKYPLTGKRIDDDKRAEAFGAGALNVTAQTLGLKSLPLVAIVYQGLIGAYLDSIYRGGSRPYRTYLRDLENKGYVTMPWQENPKPFWERLQ